MWASLILAIFIGGAPGHKATLAQQKECADQARKVFLIKQEEDQDPDAALLQDDQTSHYSVDLNTCFVRLDRQAMLKKEKILSIQIQVLDAFEGTSYGSYLWMSDPKGKKKYWDIAPTICTTGPPRSQKPCESQGEFEKALALYLEDEAAH